MDYCLNKAKSVHLNTVYSCFHITKEGLSGCDGHCVKCKAENIYYLSVYWKKYAYPWNTVLFFPENLLGSGERNLIVLIK